MLRPQLPTYHPPKYIKQAKTSNQASHPHCPGISSKNPKSQTPAQSRNKGPRGPEILKVNFPDVILESITLHGLWVDSSVLNGRTYTRLGDDIVVVNTFPNAELYSECST